MNRRKIILLTAFLVTHSILFKAESQVNGTWSGTITEHSWFGGHPGVVAEMISNISYSRNVGTATYNETGSITVDGKVISRNNCSGSGTVGFSTIRIDADNNVYTIQSSALVYHCTYLGAEPDSGELFITIDSVWDGNPRILKGSKTLVTENGGGGKLTTITTWHLTKDSETELIVTPQKYDTWLPIPGRDEQTPGPDMMTVKLELKDRNGRPSSEKAESFVLKLINTSKEKGITINMPLVPAAQQLPDLRFQPQANAVITNEGQTMTLYCPSGCLTADIRIASYDGGGWTTLTAVAKLETDSIKGKLLTPAGDENIPIPKREPGSNIASSWLDTHGNSSERYDEDQSDDNTNNGDGLSTYEEYRGVISKGAHLRLDPEKKELGVRAANLSLFGQGFDWFENASKIKIVRFWENEIDENHRRINNNAGYANVFNQCVLKFVIESLPRGTVGRAYNYGGPLTTDRIAIDLLQMQSIYLELVADARPATLKYSMLELLANTVAHEMAHGVNVNHHGTEPQEPDPQIARDNSYPPYRIFDGNRLLFESNGQANSNRTFPLENIGVKGTQQSGNISCLIAYNPYHEWAFTVGADGASIFNKVPLLSMGRRFCKDKFGTGINAGILYFGDARLGGNCLGRLDLK